MKTASVLERQTMTKIYLHLLPFCFVLYFICYLDRANIGFAALTMNKSLGFTAAEYGLGAGAFFWSYVLFQVPSNMILSRLGARRWLTVSEKSAQPTKNAASARPSEVASRSA